MTIPFSIVTTSFLTLTLETAKAQVLSPYQLGKSFSPDLVSTWTEIGKTFLKFINWINNLPENIGMLSVKVLTYIYEMLMLVLKTPLFIFNNSYLTNATMTFSIISILLVTILTMFEGFKKKFKKKHTDLKTIAKRYSVAVVGSGFAPFIFEQTFTFLNYITEAITKIGSSGLNSSAELMKNTLLNDFNFLSLIAFDIIALSMMIPLFLQNFRRFFDLMCLSAITPLALSAWVFDEHRHHFNTWWYNVKKLSLVQLVYATFICIMGLFIFGTANDLSGWGMLFKVGIVIGGLWRMSSMPNIVKSKLDNGDNVLQTGNKIKNTATDVAETVTLKKFDPLYQAKKKVVSSVVSKFNK